MSLKKDETLTLPLDANTIGVRLGVLAGLRRGEIVGLRWGDIGDGFFQVRRSVNEIDGSLREPKTSSGIRDVPIPFQLVNALKSWKQIQKEELSVLTIDQADITPVVSSSTGGLMHPQNFARWWRLRRDDFGLEGIVLHELRHTYLTMLAGGGASFQTLKDLAGRSNIAMADTYIHSDKDANFQAAKRLEEMINDESTKNSDFSSTRFLN